MKAEKINHQKGTLLIVVLYGIFLADDEKTIQILAEISPDIELLYL